MFYDTSELSHENQLHFLKQKNEVHLEDGYYKVLYNGLREEFLFMRIDYVLRNERR